MRKLLILSIALAALCTGTLAQNSFTKASAVKGCHNTLSGEVHVSVPGRAFAVIPSADGCWVFASVDPHAKGGGGGLAVIDMRGPTPILVRTIPDDPTTRKRAGLALTHDGRFLMLGAINRISVYDVAKLTSGDANPLAGEYLPKKEQPAAYFGFAITKGDRFMFVSDHNGDSVEVINLEQTRAASFQKFAVVGSIPVGYGAGAAVLSRDERYLYVTSQVANDSFHWEKVCRAPFLPPTAPMRANGIVQVIDASRAVSDSQHSVLTTIPAGCDTVGFEMDNAGKRAYVASRSDDQLLAFDTARLVTDPGHARLSSTPTRTGPVGLALLDGNRLAVGNALRFSGGKKDTEGVTVIDTKSITAQPRVLGSVSSVGPVDIVLMPAGSILLVTNYESEQVTFIRVQDLKVTGK